MSQIIKVCDKKMMKEFVFLPERIYAGNPYWAPPIWSDEIKAYTPRYNPMLENTDYCLILALEEGRVVGRNLIYIDHRYNQYYNSKIGLFGAFECENSPGTVKAIMDYSEKWLAGKGMSSIRGPIHPIAENWGFLASGFDTPAVFMSPYNPPYYPELFANLTGYEKAKDLLAYTGDSEEGYVIPERIVKFSERILKHRPNITVRRFRMNRLIEDGEHIWRITNTALADNWGYVPVERSVFLDMVKKVGPIADPDAMWFVEDNGVPIGYAFGFPDLNTILRRINGRLFPFGFLSLLFGIKHVRFFRLFGLAVMPEYHGMGLDVLLYSSLYNALKPRRVKLEANYILEDNFSIRNAIEKMGLKLLKTYRIFEKQL
jgi:ribosomal protein S18 acetylase RimI-like enzyme